MRNLKKRILSFVSAVAMVATIVPTTGLFASAENVTIDILGGSEYNPNSADKANKDFSVEIPADGTYTLSIQVQGNHNAWFAVQIDGGDKPIDARLYGDWTDSDYWENSAKTATADVTLTKGTHTVNLYTEDYGKYLSATLTGDVQLVDNTEDIKDGLKITVGSTNSSYGTAAASDATIGNDTKLTATSHSENEHPFIGWVVKAPGDSTGVNLGKANPLTVKSMGKLINAYATEKNADSVVIFAKFAEIGVYRYEAEDFVNLISEQAYQNWGYDDPTVVLEGNTGYTEGTASNTVYAKNDSDGKYYFEDGHEAKADGAGYNVVATGTYNSDWGTNDYGDHMFNGNNWNQNDSGKCKATVTVPSDAKNPQLMVRVYSKNAVVKVNVYDSKGTMTEGLFGGTDGENLSEGTYDKTMSVTPGETYTIEYQGGEQYDDPYSAAKEIEVRSEKEGTGDKVKYEMWDNKSYNDLNVAPKYSNGAAVALTGPSNGVAIPFTLAEATSVNMDIELGYNFGTLPESHVDGSLCGVWVNLYYIGENNGTPTEADKANYQIFVNKAKSGFDDVSGNATPENASDMLKATGCPAGAALYKYLTPKGENGAATYKDGTTIPGTTDNDKASDQRIVISLPQGMPQGKYMLSVAVDDGNGYDGEVHNSTNAHVDNPGTAYYDYIQFKMAEDPDVPSVFVGGADIKFTDSGVGNDGQDSKMKNTLRVTEFSDVSFEDGKMTFTPVAPEFLVNQGYEFTGWTLVIHNDPTHSLNLDTILGSADKTSYSETCAAISNYKFEAGTSIEFIANYEIGKGSQTLTVEGGTIYIPQGGGNAQNGKEDTSVYTIPVKDKNVSLSRFANVKLVADDKDNFGYWTVNGMIYSYNPEIFFSSVYNADFKVVTKDQVSSKPEATAYIDKNVEVSGFTDADNINQQKLAFLAEFSINDGTYDVKDKFGSAEFGLIYTASSTGLANMRSAKSSTSWNGTIAKCGKMVVTNQNNIIRNETFFGIGGLKKDKTYYAMSYVVYNGKVYYSDIISITPTAGENRKVTADLANN